MPDAQQLKEIIELAHPRLLALSEQQASAKPYPEKWSVKQILGHLVDSASNNHQRIVRMQEVADIGMFRYTQTHWVECQHYQAEPWRDLVNLWYFANKHLAHIIERVDRGSLSNVCDMGYPEPATLHLVISEYFRHVRHHLDQIFSGADPRERPKWKRGE